MIWCTGLQVHALEATQNGPGADAESAAGPQQTQTYPGGLASTKLGKTSTRPMGATLPVRHCTLAMHTWGFLGLLVACEHLGLLAACLAVSCAVRASVLLSQPCPSCIGLHLSPSCPAQAYLP